MFTLVRTSTGEVKQQGISFLLIDLQSPGLHQADHLLNNAPKLRVFLDGVRVPSEPLARRRGWTYATRCSNTSAQPSATSTRARRTARIRELAQSKARTGTLLEIHPSARNWRDSRSACRPRVYATGVVQSHGRRTSGPHRRAQDIGTEVAQEITHLAMSTIGYAAIESHRGRPRSYFDNRKLSIFSARMKFSATSSPSASSGSEA